ncbi:MAG: IS110 family transposase, partial [Sedimentitalea sp.]
PIFVKPFMKQHKKDAVDAKAIVEAVLRPFMGFVEVKTKEQQAQAVMFRTRDLYLRQRTQLINARHGHFAEYGVLLPSSRASVARMMSMPKEHSEDLPAPIVEIAERMTQDIEELTNTVAAIDKALKKLAQRLRTMPRKGPIAIQAFCPAAKNFNEGRGFAARLGPVTRQMSTIGKDRFGRITKMRQRDVRQLLVTGAPLMHVNMHCRAVNVSDQRVQTKRPLRRSLACENATRMIVAVALANRMARRLWAMMTKKQDYEIQVAA